MKAIVPWLLTLNFATFENANCTCAVGIERKLWVAVHSTGMQLGLSQDKWLTELRK